MIRDNQSYLPALESKRTLAVSKPSGCNRPVCPAAKAVAPSGTVLPPWLRCAEMGLCEGRYLLGMLAGKEVEPLPGETESRLSDRLEARPVQTERRSGEEIIRVREQERKRIAREIHDGPAQLVAGILLQVDYCRQLCHDDPQRVAPELDLLKDTVHRGLSDLRRIIYDLRAPGNGCRGLAEELGGYLDDWRQRNSLAVEFSCRGTVRQVDQLRAITIFRVVQEALCNVSKHAGAGRVRVELDYLPESLCLTVTDDGKGFIAERAGAEGDHYGLLGIKERVSLLNGTLRIISAPGKGTTIEVTIPVTRGGESWEKSD